MPDEQTTFGAENIQPIGIQEEMERSFLDYAMSVIVARALPDVRDGLKPVHRRILYGMFDEGWRPDRQHVKCSNVVGAVMGKYHPHGDTAIYDALARMAQDFSLRYPLIDGHGNFGSPDFGPGAMRYCVSGDMLLRAIDGTIRIDAVADLEPNSEADIELKVLDRRGDPVRATKLFHSGSRPTLRLRTREGFELVGTRNHPVLCLVPVAGVPLLLWKLLEEMGPGDFVAIARDANPWPFGHVPYLAEYTRSRPDSDECDGVVRAVTECGYYYATVASVEDAGVQPVYSIKVESDDHSFIANGFVNHNTEARLAPLAMQLIGEIREDTVDFDPTYDNRGEEPHVLPARFPNLLVNGSDGIAVGMATKIPPHNMAEVVDATSYYVDHPDATAEELMQFVKGPDFPTRGLIMGRDGVKEAYTTGRGSVRMRGRAVVEETRSGRAQIVITELPYQVSPGRFIEKVKELKEAGRLGDVADLKNETAREGLRLVVVLKRDAVPQVVLNQLYKLTPLQENFPANMVALVDGVPRTLRLNEMIGYYVDHQREVVTRRTRHRLDEAEKRAHVLEGYIIALDNIDAVIALIRASADTEAARTGLMEQFDMSEIQATVVLDMPLRRLTALEVEKVREELSEKRKEIADYRDILKKPARVRAIVKEELVEVRKDYPEGRRTEVRPDVGDLDLEDLIADDELVITLSAGGYIKAVAADTYRRQGRGGRGVQGANLKAEDVIERVLHTTAHSYLLLFTNLGRVYRLKGHEVPLMERTARGQHIKNLLSLRGNERVQAMIDTRDYETQRYLLFATKLGGVKKTAFNAYDSSLSTGLIAINLREDDEVVDVLPTSGRDRVVLVSRRGMAICFDENDARAMGRAAAGVRGMRLREGDEVVGAVLGDDQLDLLLITTGGYGKRTRMREFRPQGRGGKGLIAIKTGGRGRGEVLAVGAVRELDELFVINSQGVGIRVGAGGISRQGRSATGVRVQNLDEGATVSAVALIPRDNGEQELTP